MQDDLSTSHTASVRGNTQGNLLSKTSTVAHSAARVFREFKWGLLTLFLLMVVVISLIYDDGKKGQGARGLPSGDLAARPSGPESPGGPTDNPLLNGQDQPPAAHQDAVSPRPGSVSQHQDPFGAGSQSLHPAPQGGELQPGRLRTEVPRPPQGFDRGYLQRQGATGRQPGQPFGEQAWGVVGGNPVPEQQGPRMNGPGGASGAWASGGPSGPAAIGTGQGPTSSYRVKSGDTLGAIAQQLYPGRARAGQKLLQEANKDILSDPRKLRIGMQLKVPQLPPVVSAQGTGSGLAGSGVAGAPPTGSSTPAVLGPNPVPEARPNPSGQTAQSSGSGREELYIVRAGDTLEGIAKKVYNNKDRWREIYEGNKDKMSSPTQLRVGVELRINQKPAAQEQAKPKESRKTLAEVSGPHVEVLPAARVDAPSETLSEMP